MKDRFDKEQEEIDKQFNLFFKIIIVLGSLLIISLSFLFTIIGIAIFTNCL